MFGKISQDIGFLGLSAAPFQWVSAQFNLSLTNPNLGSVIKEIQAQSDYQFSMTISLLLFNLNL